MKVNSKSTLSVSETVVDTGGDNRSPIKFRARLQLNSALKAPKMDIQTGDESFF